MIVIRINKKGIYVNALLGLREAMRKSGEKRNAEVARMLARKLCLVETL